MYRLEEQMPEDDNTTRTIENEKLRIDSTMAQQKKEDKRETKRIAREKKPKPRKQGRKKRQ